MNLEQRVYKKLLDVPKGKITTYGELAKAVGIKNGQRVIGNIMNKNPYPGIIPCHRVVKSDKSIGGYAYGQDVKSNMLTKEGIKIHTKFALTDSIAHWVIDYVKEHKIDLLVVDYPKLSMVEATHHDDIINQIHHKANCHVLTMKQ